jgi:hypothetical protein
MNTRNFGPHFFLLPLLTVLLWCAPTTAQTGRRLTGTLVTKDNKSAPQVKIYAGTTATVTDAEGNFSLTIPPDVTRLRIEGKNVITKEITVRPAENNLLIQVEYTIPPLHDSIVIEATALEPGLERRDEAIYKNGCVPPN